MATKPKPPTKPKPVKQFDELRSAIDEGFRLVIERISHGPAISTSIELLEELKASLIKKVSDLK